MHKFQRFQQWSKEKMGSDVKSGPTDDFKALEQEMNIRHEGLEKMHASTTAYVKSLNKRGESDGREKLTAIASLGSAMTKHGEIFEAGNHFGEALLGFGQANERIARSQDAYASHITTTWLAALDKSLAQMKDYQSARKKLESRKYVYESSITKMQKAKKEDYKTDEELRTAKAKYEESTEDVYRRMQDIIENEQDNTQDLYAFVEAELNYHDRCKEVLLQLQNRWPGELAPPTLPNRPIRAASHNTSLASQPSSQPGTPFREAAGYDFPPRPAMLSRTNTAEAMARTTRIPSIDAASIRNAAPLRSIKTRGPPAGAGFNYDVFNDGGAEDDSSPEERSSSPATSVSQGTSISRNTSYSTLNSVPKSKKAPPPPPPPSRGTKPPPPPPPMKRSALSSSAVPGL